MSYARWSNSDWYIYWHNDSLIDYPPGEENLAKNQRLAVWGRCPERPIYTHSEIVDIVANNWYGLIPGYTECDAGEQQVCRDCLQKWLQEVKDLDVPPGTWI